MKKNLGGRGNPLERGFPLPPNLPAPPRTSPTTPPLSKRRFVPVSLSGGVMGEIFVGLGGADLLQSAAIALDWWVGCAGQQDGSFPTVAPKDQRCRERPVCRSA